MSNEKQDFTDAELLRMKAEKQLIEKHEKADNPEMEIDAKRLLHELQVHQIELEMQNEELHIANETAEKALKKYTMLYDFAPMGYFSLDSDARICDLNFTGAELLGDRRFSLVNSNFKLFVSQDSLPAFIRFINRVFSGNTRESCNVSLSYDNKPLTYVYMEGIVIDGDQNCLLSVVDISGFNKEERK